MSTSDEKLGRRRIDDCELMPPAPLTQRSFTAQTGDPLSEGQRALWYWQRLNPRDPGYNLVASAAMRGDVDVDLLQTAVAAMTARHPQLRSVFPLVDGKPRRKTAELETLTIRRIDASTWSESEYRRRWDEISDQPFDLENGPLLRATILTRGPQEQVVHLCLHHSVVDFWSSMQMLYETCIDYRSARLGVPTPIGDEAADYCEYVADEAEMLAGPEGQRLREYWRTQLAGAPTTLRMPLDRLGDENPIRQGNGCDRVIDPDLAAKLRNFARSQGATPYVVCLTAFSALLHRWTGQEDLLIGTPYHGRALADWRGIVGYFSNTAVIRSRCDASKSFASLLHDVKVTVQNAIAHGRYPFSQLSDELADRSAVGRPPLVQAALSWQKVQRLPGLRHRRRGAKDSVAVFDGINAEVACNIEQRGAPFELLLQIHDDGESFDIHWQYDRHLFEAASIERLADQYVELLAAIVDDPDLAPTERPTASVAERAQLDAWNSTAVAYPQNVCLHTLIEEQVARAPLNTAVRFGEQTLSYAELDAEAGRLAAKLNACGIGADAVVGVYLHRRAEMVTALYGILKSGGAYLPLNPDDPWDRTAFTLQDAGVDVVVTERRFADDVLRAGVRVICVDGDASADESSACDATTVSIPGPRNLAYVIYTSGSTGKPKGAMIEHRSIVNRLLWMQDEYRLSAADRVLQKTPYTFDVSVWEFFWPLLVGAEIVVAEPGGHRDPAYLVRTIADYGVTTLHFVPTMLRAFLQHNDVERLKNVKRVFASGEALTPDLVELFHERCRCELHNLYGPTEAAVDVTYFPCLSQKRRASIPIGRPIANTEILVLNRSLEPQPIGMLGELYIGGINLARGYRNREDLTAERFVPHPTRPGERLYRTGDVARWTAAGQVEYHGRCDGQVKLGGNRIELGEIEIALAALPNVAHCAVVVREDAVGHKQLVGYVVPVEGATLAPSQLRIDLAARLPQYMVPSIFMELTALPQTTSGKIDRNALPAPTNEREDRSHSVPYVAARNADEQALATVFCEVLNLERVGVEDNFFDLGGASSQAVEIIHRAGLLGYTLTPDILFRTPTIAGIAETCRHPQPITGNVVVESLGVYLPPKVLSTEEVVQGCSRKLSLPLGRLTGIKSRRVVEAGEYAWDLAVRAVERCLAKSQATAADVDAVICCNISRYDGPNFEFSYEPSTAAKLCSHFGFHDAVALDVSNACAGMFTGISLGEGLLKSGHCRRVLVVSGEYISYLAETAQRTIESDFDSRLPCLTLGDAGAAVMLEGSSRSDVGFAELDLCTLAQHSELCIAKWTAAGPIMFTDMLKVSQVITQQGLEHWLHTAKRKNWPLSRVNHMIPHQVSQTTIISGFNELRKRAGVDVPTETVISNVAERGNTATTSHWVAVWDHVQSGRIKSGDNVMFGVSGSGITVGTGLYRFDDLPDRLRSESPTAISKAATKSANNVSRQVRPRRFDPTLTRAVIGGVGAVRPDASVRTTMDLALAAARSSLAEANVKSSDIGLLLYTGIYRDEYLSEPAFAAMMGDQLRLHDPNAAGYPPFFAFDLLNGSIGFLQGCYLAAQRIQAGRIPAALVATAEVEPHPQHPIGISPSGAAFLLQAGSTTTGGAAGFGDFVFRNDWRRGFARTAISHLATGSDYDLKIDVTASPDLHADYVELLADAMDELRDLERLNWDDVDCVLPPHLGHEFLQLLADRVPQLRNKLVFDDGGTGDLFTASLPFAWQAAQKQGRTQRGSVALLLGVGAGLQAGCASYRFG